REREALAVVVGGALQLLEPAPLPGFGAAVRVGVAVDQVADANVGLGCHGEGAVVVRGDRNLVLTGAFAIHQNGEVPVFDGCRACLGKPRRQSCQNEYPASGDHSTPLRYSGIGRVFTAAQDYNDGVETSQGEVRGVCLTRAYRAGTICVNGRI